MIINELLGFLKYIGKLPILALIMCIVAVLGDYYCKEAVRDPDKISSNCVIRRIGKGRAVEIAGWVINDDTIHAQSFTIKGNGKGKIYGIEAISKVDKVQKDDNFKKGNIYISLDRLSVNAKCSFGIIASNTFKIEPILRAGWGRGGRKDINIMKETPDTDKNIANSDDEVLYNKALQKYVKHNSVN